MVQQVGPELGVRYVIEGSTRRSGDRVRTTAQLIDTETGRHLWADRYDSDLADLFAVQDEIVERILGAIELEILKLETARARGKTTDSLTAWDLVLRSMWHFPQVTEAGNRQARELFHQAISVSPSLAEGHIWLGRCNAGRIAHS
jgi:adenylate cyclase